MTTVPGANMSASSAAIAYHDTLASGWSQRYASGGFKRRADFFVDEILPSLDVSGRWIDVGCGSGFFSRILADAGAEVLGVDGSAAMVAAARAFPAASNPPRYEIDAVDNLQRPDAGYDGALLLSVLEYLDEPQRALAAVVRLLRPGATLILSAPNRRSSLRRVQRRLRGFSARLGGRAFPYLESSKNAWSRDELIALASANGLACEAVRGFDPVAPRALWPLLSPSLWFALCRKPRGEAKAGEARS